jgi:hypothetical protein
MHLKNPLLKFNNNNNKSFSDYIKKSQNDYMKLFIKCNEERNIRKILGLDNSTSPPPINKKDLLFSSIILLSLSTTIYYFYSTKR